jgi:hypothetical protein
MSANRAALCRATRPDRVPIYVAAATTAVHFSLYFVAFAIDLARSLPGPYSALDRVLWALGLVLSLPLLTAAQRLPVGVVSSQGAFWLLVFANSVIWGIAAGTIIWALRRRRSRARRETQK